MDLRKASLLVVDDDRDLLTAARLLLKPKVHAVIVESNPENLLNILSKNTVDLILLDMNYKSTINTGNEGLYWLSVIKSKYPLVKIVMITAYGAVDLAVQSLKLGAEDFVVKPWQNESLLETIGSALSSSQKPVDTPELLNTPGLKMIGTSAIMEDLQYKIRKIAPTDANILILGENGTGKDLIADAIHQLSGRKAQPYVKVDIGALTETLFESELFGYKKGAFTDAREDRKGRFEAANCGTLFLNEIGNVNLPQQAKLLSALQNREIVPLGSHKAIPVDIRLLSATNVPLGMLSDESRFRKDLIYRINTVDIQVPPLRDRGDDVVLLANYFLNFYSKKYHKAIGGLESGATKKLCGYHFPGNIRELQYTMERAVIMSETETLREGDILFSPIEYVANGQTPDTSTPQTPKSLEEVERYTIQSAMKRHQGNISKAAEELGLTRAALYRRLEKYSI